MNESLGKINGCVLFMVQDEKIRLGTVFTGTGISPAASSKSIFFCTASVYPSVSGLVTLISPGFVLSLK